MSVEQIVGKYFPQIQVEYTEYVPMNEAKSDAATITLRVPTAMLREYLASKGQTKELPDPVDFWVDSGLVNKLRGSNKQVESQHEPLDDILDFLGGEVTGSYQGLAVQEQIKLSITEVPEFYTD